MRREYSYTDYDAMGAVFNNKGAIITPSYLYNLPQAFTDTALDYLAGLSIGPEGLKGSNKYVPETCSLKVIEISPQIFGPGVSLTALVFEILELWLISETPLLPTHLSNLKAVTMLSRSQLVDGKRATTQVTDRDITAVKELCHRLSEQFTALSLAEKTIVDFVVLNSIIFIVYN